MRKFLGAWLCLVLGAVLITTGLNTGSSGTVGSVVVPPTCGSPDVGLANPCPTAVVTVHETTTTTPGGAVRAAVTPPAGGWTVHVTSPCQSTVDGSKPMDETLTVPDGGSAQSQALFAFPDASDTTKCVYTLTEDLVVGYTAAFTPSNTFTFTVSAGIAENVSVNLTNTTPGPTPTPTTSSAAPPKTSTSATVAPSSTARTTEPAGGAVVATSTSGSGGLASTGPRTRVDATLIVGIALCLLGLGLLVAGRVERRRARHA